MLWILFALGAALSWGLYGPALHGGQVQLGSPMRALLCVGVAYFLIGVLVPVATLSASGELNGFTMKGSVAAMVTALITAGAGVPAMAANASPGHAPGAQNVRHQETTELTSGWSIRSSAGIGDSGTAISRPGCWRTAVIRTSSTPTIWRRCRRSSST